MSKRRVTRNALSSERISVRERSNPRALVAAAEAPAVVQEEAVVADVDAVAVAAVELLARGVHHDSPSGSLLCPIIKGGDLRTPVQYVARKYV